MVRATKGGSGTKLLVLFFERRNIVMGVQNLASVHVEPAAVFYFSRKAGAKPFPKQKFIKKIRLKTSAHRPARAFPTENFVAMNFSNENFALRAVARFFSSSHESRVIESDLKHAST